jgi:hypothetical protein
MASNPQDVHVKIFHNDAYRRFMLPHKTALPNNDIPYFDGSVWKDLRARLETLYPDLQQTPYLIFSQSKGLSCIVVEASWLTCALVPSQLQHVPWTASQSERCSCNANPPSHAVACVFSHFCLPSLTL